MLSRADIKFVRSLAERKFRLAARAFVAEGHKTVDDLRQSLRLRLLIDDKNDVERCTMMRTPQGVMAVFDIPSYPLPTPDEIGTNIILALDCVQDPGNVGTIIRLADWFGIEHIMLGTGCADAFAPKTVQATMGALSRVKTHECNLREWLGSLPEGTPIIGTALDGESIYQAQLPRAAVVVMGNEGNGISPEVRSMLTHNLLIPSYPPLRKTSESLNVAIATAIVCSEFRRN